MMLHTAKVLFGLAPRFLPALALLLLTAPASAGFIIGPGDIDTTAWAGIGDAINTDLSNPITLSPGTYVASQFNYIFLNAPGYLTIGSLTPIVMTVNNGLSDLVPIAIGDAVTFNGTDTPFMSSPFGGIDTFTLTRTTTVYAAFYYHVSPPPGSGETRDPLPYANGPYGSVIGYYDGAAPPVLNTPISAPMTDYAYNLFAFSIQIDPVPVPAPASVVLLLLTGLPLFGLAARMGRRRCL